MRDDKKMFHEKKITYFSQNGNRLFVVSFPLHITSSMFTIIFFTMCDYVLGNSSSSCHDRDLDDALNLTGVFLFLLFSTKRG